MLKITQRDLPSTPHKDTITTTTQKCAWVSHMPLLYMWRSTNPKPLTCKRLICVPHHTPCQIWTVDQISNDIMRPAFGFTKSVTLNSTIYIWPRITFKVRLLFWTFYPPQPRTNLSIELLSFVVLIPPEE